MLPTMPSPSTLPNKLIEKPPIETVKNAIKTVLSNESGDNRKRATDWLESLKNSVYAWEICDELLKEKESIQICYLAAHMLRQKISKDFNELPLEYYSSLKDSIFHHLQTIDDYAVQGQLTMAMADLALLLKDWTNPIQDLGRQLCLYYQINFASSPIDLASIDKALQNRLIFAYMLHQMCDLNHNHSERPRKIGANRREEFEDYLISQCQVFIEWSVSALAETSNFKALFRADAPLESKQKIQGLEEQAVSRCLSSADKLIGQIYLCYSAWTRIFDESSALESVSIVGHAINDLKDTSCPETTHRFASEAYVAAASCCEDNYNSDFLLSYLVENVYSLEKAFSDTVANEDIERSSNLMRIFTTVAEVSCADRVINKRDFKLMDLLLSCLTHYDFEIVEETYSFWRLLIEHLQNRLKSAEYGPFIPYIDRFVMSVTKLCQFDPDEDSVISRDQDIHNFREESRDVICAVMYITNVETFLRDNKVIDTLGVELSKVSWEVVEGVLFLVSCLINMLTRDENLTKKQIFDCVLAQQTNGQDIQTMMATKQVPIRIGSGAGEVHPQIVATSLKIIGSLDSLLYDSPDYLALAVNYILASISNPTHRNRLMSHAASALCSIMELNATRHFSNCQELLVIIKDLCANLDQYEDATTDLLKCSSFMADAIKETEIKDQFLCEIIRGNLNTLKKILSEPKREESEIAQHLDRLSTIFRNTTIHPSVVSELKNLNSLVDTELWPVMMKVLEIYASERGLAIEKTCRSIRYLLRCIKPEWMIQRVAETMVSLYRTYPQSSSPLYICSILVDEFANRSQEINQGLFGLLEIFCNLTFTLLEMNTNQATSLLTMKSYPETIDDMMRLFGRFLRKCPNEFLNCKALESIIELCLSSLRIDHPDANTQVSRFVTNFIGLGKSEEHLNIQTAIKNVLGARFTDAVINACLFHIPSHLIVEEAEILLTLCSFDKDLFTSWINTTVANLPKTNIQGLESVTQEQLDDFRKTIITADTPKKMINSLRALARQYN